MHLAARHKDRAAVLDRDVTLIRSQHSLPGQDKDLVLPPVAVVGGGIARLYLKDAHYKVRRSLVRPDDDAHRHALQGWLSLYRSKISNQDHLLLLPWDGTRI